MHRRLLKLRRILAFTLLELSVSLAVVGILLGGAVIVIQQQAKKSVQEEATDDIDAIVEALVKFKIRKGHLPCPASLTELPSVSTFGKEANAGDCTFTTAPAGTSRFETAASSGVFVVSGMVPVAELNLPVDKWSDKFGNRYSYTVMQTLTEPSTFEAGVASLVVKTGSADRQFTDGAFVVASLGKEAQGGYRFESGALVSACGTTTLDSENCDGDITFIDTEIADSQTGSTYYSDTVRWKSKQHFADIAITGGSPSPSGSSSPTYGTPPTDYAFRMDGVAADDYAGTSVAVGDINGDGFGDAIIGAQTGSGDSGYVYVAFGTASGINAHPESLSTLDGTNGFKLHGFWDVGSAVSAGDINNDGFDDVIIGDVYGGFLGCGGSCWINVGRVYVVFGKASGWAADTDIHALNGTNGFLLTGTASNDLTGFAVSTGDINNDGFDDVIVGAPYADPSGRSAAGSTYVVFGKAGVWAATTALSSLNGTTGFRLDGATAGDLAGSAVATGDVNNDGFDDVIVGAPYANVARGNSFVIFGKAGAWAATTVLSALNGTDGIRLDGVADYDQSGGAISSGDVNNDGFDDVIIGANDADSGGNSSNGSTYVVFGKASGWSSTIALSLLDGVTGFRLDGGTASEYSGYGVTSGDFNGDGYDDVIVGAPQYAANSQIGAVYVVFGKAGAWTATTSLSTLNATSGFRLTGPTLGDKVGWKIAIGDITGDGYADILGGAREADYNGVLNSGSVWGVYGRPSTDPLPKINNNLNVLCECIPPPTKKASRVDGESGGNLSFSTAIGDINGDGFGDAIMGSTAGDRVAVVFGKEDGIDAHPAAISILDGTNGFVVVKGSTYTNMLGHRVASGDINGDGFDDVVAGTFDGAGFVIFGKASGWGATFQLSTLNGTNGFQAAFGQELAVGDVNNDGFDDVIASQVGGNHANVVFGKASGWPAVWSESLNGTNGFSVGGINGGTVIGQPQDLLSTGDINGDGISDIIIGGPYANNGAGVRSGSAYVVFGKTSGWAASTALNTTNLNGTTGFRLDGIAAGMEAGSSVSSGDVNGDGFDDVIVGAQGSGLGGGSSGSTFVVFGKASGWASSLAMNTTNLNGTTGFRLDGGPAGNTYRSGYGVASADFNGDGFDDIAINSFDPNFLVFGKASGWTATVDVTTLNPGSGFELMGGGVGNSYPGGTIAFGDLTGDGNADLLIGSWSHLSIGSGWVVYGHPTRWKKPSYRLNQLCCYGTPPTDDAFRADGVTAGDGAGSVYDNIGRALAIGDINGDGFGDAIIATLTSVNHGRVYVVFGSATGINWHPNSLGNLDGTNGFRLDGPTPYVWSGLSVASGDINNDGYDDVIVGSWGENGNAGYTYVVFGKASGWAATSSLSSVNGTTGFRLDGVGPGQDISGYSVSAGDINGDGYDDVMVGAALNNHGGGNTGSAYIVFGKAGAWAASTSLSTLNGTTGFRLDGVGAAGVMQISKGDINGDGFEDAIIAAGEVDYTYVVFGKASGWAAATSLSTLNGTTGFRLQGVSGNVMDAPVASGDINADGYDDVIIGAIGTDQGINVDVGSTYVVFGKASGWAATELLSSLNGTTGFRLDGANQQDYTGGSVDSGDVNGDGFDDVIFGAAGADPSSMSWAGLTYVVFGKASGWTSTQDLQATLNGTNGFMLFGSTANDQSGGFVSVGDITGDNYADILIGAGWASYNSLANSGSVYGVYGKPISWSASYDLNTLAGIVPAGPDCPAPSGTPITGVTYSVSTNYGYSGYTDEALMRDGNCDSADTTAATNNNGGEYIQADLGANYDVSKIHIAPIPSTFGGWGAGYLNGREIQYSTDGSTWSLHDITWGHADGSTTTYNVNFNARYIRIYVGTSDWIGLGDFWFEGSGGGGGGGCSANFLGIDSVTGGNWKGIYGTQGYDIAGDYSSMPSYGSHTVPSNSLVVSQDPSSDIRALEKAASSDRIEAFYSISNLPGINVDFNDADTHKLSVYVSNLYWGNQTQSLTTYVKEASTGNTLSYQNLYLSNNTPGYFLSWTVNCDVIIDTYANTAGAQINGIFYDPVPTGGGGGGATATYAGSEDMSTSGNWIGTYGQDGHYLPSFNSQPSYASVWIAGNPSMTQDLISDPSSNGWALQKPGNPSERREELFRADGTVYVYFDSNDTTPRNVTLYYYQTNGFFNFADVNVRSMSDNTLLSTNGIGMNHQQGRYSTWTVSGDVYFEIITTGGAIGLAGIFFDTPSGGGGGGP